MMLAVIMRALLDRVRRSALDGVLAPAAAAFDLVARPERRRAFGGPLNDQAFRRLIVEGVISACGLRAVVETGSHLGTTTEFFARSGVESVWTVEYVPRFYWYTVLRLLKHTQVRVLRGDSRAALTKLSQKPITSTPTLFYLDAHWGADLPLAAEIRIIADHWQAWVAVIDDFKVPGDVGYGFDSYGAESTLDAAYCERIGVEGLRLYYPALDSRFESGRRRGCVVLTNVPAMTEFLDQLPALLRTA